MLICQMSIVCLCSRFTFTTADPQCNWDTAVLVYTALNGWKRSFELNTDILTFPGWAVKIAYISYTGATGWSDLVIWTINWGCINYCSPYWCGCMSSVSLLLWCYQRMDGYNGSWSWMCWVSLRIDRLCDFLHSIEMMDVHPLRSTSIRYDTILIYLSLPSPCYHSILYVPLAITKKRMIR